MKNSQAFRGNRGGGGECPTGKALCTLETLWNKPVRPLAIERWSSFRGQYCIRTMSVWDLGKCPLLRVVLYLESHFSEVPLYTSYTMAGAKKLTVTIPKWLVSNLPSFQNHPPTQSSNIPEITRPFSFICTKRHFFARRQLSISTVITTIPTECD